MTTRIKICGITRVEDARYAAQAGTHAIGLMFHPASPRYVTLDQALAIYQALPPFVMSVGVWVDPSPESVYSVLAKLPLSVLQFHGQEPAEFCRQFGLPYLKAVQVKPGLDLRDYAARYPDAKGLLLDTFSQGLAGGTGKTFDWNLIPSGLSLPVILSGGLNPQNVTAAIRQIRPAAVDVSSGVESAKGIKEPAKITAFIQGVHDAQL